MLNRISVNALLKSVIGVMALAVTVVFAVGAWDSWSRLVVAERMAGVAEASGPIFTVLHNVRVDRSSTTRNLRSDKQLPTPDPLVKQVRDAEMPALKSSLSALAAADFPERQSVVATLTEKIAKLTALQSEADTAVTQPKAQRRAGLADEYFDEVNKLVDFLDNASAQLTKSIKLQDSYVDQLMALKELAWLARNAAGDVSVMISNGIAGQPMPADVMAQYAALVGKADIAWEALQNIASGLPRSERFAAALDKAKHEFFGSDYIDTRMKIMKTLAAGQPVNMTTAQWTPMSVAKLASLLNVAEVSLDLAKEHTATLRADALWKLSIDLGLLLAAVALAGGMTLLVSRRVTGPLRRLASVLVDLTNDRIVEVPYARRGDEVGAIAKATEVFKQSIGEKIVNLRVRSALDVTQSNVMIADDQYSIIYMNSTLQQMLKSVEGELRKALPNFDADKLLGINMDAFHKNPAHQRAVMDGLTGTRESNITVGSQIFKHIATPIVDRHGKRVGTAVEWRNVTAERAIEAEVDTVVRAVADGDFSQRIPTAGKQAFMLNLANHVNALCDNTGGALGDIAAMMAGLADGDLTQRVTANHRGMFGKVKDDANSMAERIGTTMAEIKSSAREVTSAAAEIATSATDLSQRTEMQAASLEETSASMEEIAATVKKNAANAQAANDSAASTREVAERGGQVVGKAVEAMARIEDSSRKISDIIGVIDEIARQTNLLALNAAVEAARAGDAGRGFAVVASEVRSLAQRSSQAAKDIKDLIINSNGQVKDGVDLVNRAGASLNGIVDSINKVAAIVADIATASAEQAQGVEQIGRALTQMDDATQQNSALVEQNAATAKMLEQQAQAVDARVAFFRVDGAAPAVAAAAAVGLEPSTAMTLDQAVEKHAEWKVKLRSAITRQQTLDTPTIAKDNCCQLGKWLYGEGRAKFGNRTEFGSLMSLHKTFHAEAAGISELINDKKYAEASRAIGDKTAYDKASRSVINAINALKRVAAA